LDPSGEKKKKKERKKFKTPKGRGAKGIGGTLIWACLHKKGGRGEKRV